MTTSFDLTPIGRVESSLIDPELAPKQCDEGAPPAWLVLDPAVGAGLADLRVGDAIVVLTWLDRADRTVLEVHPRDERRRPARGVFSTRSQHRPNPIGLHTTHIVQIDGLRVLVDALEALDQTPILDLKPVLGTVEQR